MIEQIFKERLQIKIEKMLGKKLHKSSMEGLSTVLFRTVMYALQNKKIENGIFKGYHVHSSELKLLKRNKIAQEFIFHNFNEDGNEIGPQFPFFCRIDNSTYHANNARVGSNGYSHWYEMDKTLNDVINETFVYLKCAFNANAKYGKKTDEYRERLSRIATLPKDVNKNDYFKIEHNKFEHIVNKFINGTYEGGSIIIKNSKYFDNNYVYCSNISELKSRLNGNGRQYSTIGILRKDVRKFILEGYNEIDLNTAAQTIFLNLYYDLNMCLSAVKENFPMHYELITNKKAFREKVFYKFKKSIDSDFDMEDAKKLITSITYSPKQRVIYQYCVRRGMSKKRIAEAKSFIEPFIDETIKIRGYVLSKYYANNPVIKEMIDKDIEEANKKLKGRGKGKSLEDRRMFRIYEIFESKIRNEMIRLISNKIEGPIFQVHDCIIYDGKIDIRELLDETRRSTNFLLGVTHEKL